MSPSVVRFSESERAYFLVQVALAQITGVQETATQASLSQWVPGLLYYDHKH